MTENALCRLFAIDEDGLARRRELVRLGEADRRRLAALVPWARRVAPGIARAFYDHQFVFAPTRHFFEQIARQKGVSLEVLRGVLKKTQAAYFVGVFEGARSGFDVDYFEQRLRVGVAHDRIDLPFKWYIGSYPLYFELARRALRRARWWRPRFVARVEEAILKVFNLDQQAIGDAFLLSTFRSMHVDLSTVDVAPGEDRTEHVGELKRTISHLTQQLGQHAVTMASAAEELHVIAGEMASGTQETSQQSRTLAEAAHEMETSISEIARSAERAASVAAAGAGEADEVRGVIAELGRASEEIGEVVKVIATIASQTNLLSLNASIEAVRAGDAGSGFQVVAREVKELAAKTAASTNDISQRINAIQSRVGAMQHSIESIAATVGEINGLQQTIAAAVEQQSHTTREIGRHIGALAGAAERSSEQVEQTSTSAGELAKQAADLQSLVSRFHA